MSAVIRQFPVAYAVFRACWLSLTIGAGVMIESKEQLLSGFSTAAKAFVEQPNPVTGIDLDDAAVALKRYVLSEMRDQETASLLARFPKLIRALDSASLSGMITDVERRLR